jgi:sialic acid synthase SpsE
MRGLAEETRQEVYEYLLENVDSKDREDPDIEGLDSFQKEELQEMLDQAEEMESMAGEMEDPLGHPSQEEIEAFLRSLKDPGPDYRGL